MSNLKKNLKSSENFYYGGIFTLRNKPCDFVIDINHPKPGSKPVKIYQIGGMDGSISFAYETSKGLVRLNKNTGMIEEENILGSFLKLKPKNYPDFFLKNGFLFETKKDEYQSLNEESIQQLISRLKTCVDLINEITNNNKSYKNILNNAFDLFSADTVNVKLGIEKIYSSAIHSLYRDILDNNRLTNDNGIRKLKNANGDFEIKDTIYDSYILDSDNYYEYQEDSDDAFYKRLMYVYVNKKSEYSNEEKYIIDTLFHYFHDFLPKATADTELDDKLKDGVITFAKLMVKEEIDHNIKGVHASYDTNKMEPKWRVDNLFTALYMSLFYLRANNYIYKQCPHCGTYFVVSRTTSKRVYCTDNCRNNAAAKRFRKKNAKA